MSDASCSFNVRSETHRIQPAEARFPLERLPRNLSRNICRRQARRKVTGEFTKSGLLHYPLQRHNTTRLVANMTDHFDMSTCALYGSLETVAERRLTQSQKLFQQIMNNSSHCMLPPKYNDIITGRFRSAEHHFLRFS